jgi:hypothetical protein
MVTLPEIRRLLARWLPLDAASPVHALALMLAGYLVANSAITLTQGGLEVLAQTSSAASILDVVAQELLFAASFELHQLRRDLVYRRPVGSRMGSDAWRALCADALDAPERGGLAG